LNRSKPPGTPFVPEFGPVGLWPPDGLPPAGARPEGEAPGEGVTTVGFEITVVKLDVLAGLVLDGAAEMTPLPAFALSDEVELCTAERPLGRLGDCDAGNNDPDTGSACEPVLLEPTDAPLLGAMDVIDCSGCPFCEPAKIE
jgi:hypothetical protein